jgi:hypothetical protein
VAVKAYENFQDLCEHVLSLGQADVDACGCGVDYNLDWPADALFLVNCPPRVVIMKIAHQ